MREVVPPCSLMRPLDVVCAGALQTYRLARAVEALARGGESVLFQFGKTVPCQEVRKAFHLQRELESEMAFPALDVRG
jgi:hypothetical protein